MPNSIKVSKIRAQTVIADHTKIQNISPFTSILFRFETFQHKMAKHSPVTKPIISKIQALVPQPNPAIAQVKMTVII